MNKQTVEQHLKNAIAQATPNVLDEILAGNYQQEPAAAEKVQGKILPFSKLRKLSGLVAACLVLMIFSGSLYFYSANYRVSSMIELDVNPSIGIAISSTKKVIETRADNEDAKAILDGMDLKGVDLNVAMNAIIGSMVQHGYLTESDNAILVTVTDKNAKKADNLRQEVVTNIEASLTENQMTAVVYDQKVSSPSDDLLALAETYGITYTKANFIQKLIEKDPSLDIKDLAPLTLSAIADLIDERNIDISDLQDYEYGKDVADSIAKNEEDSAVTGITETSPSEDPLSETSTTEQSSSTTEESSDDGTLPESTTEAVSPSESSSEEPTTEAPRHEKVKVSYTEFFDNIILVEFAGKVRWKNPTVSVSDSEGRYYLAMLGSTDEDVCEIYVYGLRHTGEYTVTISGVKYRNMEIYDTVSSRFEVEEIPASQPETMPTEASTEPTESTEPVSTDPTESTEPVSTDPSAEAESTDPTDPTDSSETDSTEETTARATALRDVRITGIKPEDDEIYEITLGSEVNWVKPVITVTDTDGKSYNVVIEELKSKSFRISIEGLTGGMTYTIKVKGITNVESQLKTSATAFYTIAE